jgi:hypothetical protein
MYRIFLYRYMYLYRYRPGLLISKYNKQSITDPFYTETIGVKMKRCSGGTHRVAPVRLAGGGQPVSAGPP